MNMTKKKMAPLNMYSFESFISSLLKVSRSCCPSASCPASSHPRRPLPFSSTHAYSTRAAVALAGAVVLTWALEVFVELALAAGVVSF